MFNNKACMYLRLSKDDGINEESNSIKNQRDLIQNYALREGIEIVREFIDDGYSGTNYDRPDFQRMIEEIHKEKRDFDIVIVKDLSRLGRDYIGAGKYIQRVFPKENIRFISVNDTYDSLKADTNDTHLILPIKNFINDSYARDISNKVKSSQKIKREKGEYIGSFAPYGYKKSEENKNKLIIDDDVKDIVKNIFDMKLQGYSSKGIAEELNSLGIDSPKIYKEKQGLNYRGGFQTIQGGNWSAQSINRIIEDEVYIGHTLQGKSATINYKNKRQIEKNKKDWVKVENTHDPIISNEVFKIANTMKNRDLNTRNKNKIDDFAGMLFCKDCGSPLVRRKVNYTGGPRIYYICSKYNKKKECTRHSIKKEELEKIVTRLLKKYISFNENLYKAVQKIDYIKPFKDNKIKILEREKKMIEELLSSLYIDLGENIITKEEYLIFRKNYLEQYNKIEKSIKNRLEKEDLVKKSIEENKDWIIDIKKYKSLNKLDRLSLVMLVDKILVGENKKIDIVFNHKEELYFLENVVKEKKKQEKKQEKNRILGLRDRKNKVLPMKEVYYG